MSNDAPTSADRIRHTVEVRAHGWRLDHYLTRLYPNFSRSAFQRVIDDGQVFVNGLPAKISRRLRVNDVVEFRLPESADRTVPAEDLPLDVLYDDDQLIVINKAANMIVHPGRGRYTGTLVGALQFHFDQLSDAAGHLRAGIVHRLDRDTTGVLVVAKDNTVHNLLSKQFEQRTVEKEYRALVWGEVSFDRDYMETHVRVSNRNRERMMVCPEGGTARHAATFYEVQERFRGFSYMRLCPQTGRTHQLRVHMHHLGHPIVADSLYEGRSSLRKSDLVENLPPEEDEVYIERQALHALSLSFDHPATGERMTFEAPLPADMTRALEAVRTYRPKTGKRPA
ncbi:RluA family pseudouridine synthase [Planctellipticum variicoloris]|uniref:RluA family pseudouridine synthase n=1 Tax=Planctellipticum variicoloris TaxID=3064265 RepID=UPI003013A7AE|nr:RluA family pseudouridine synthase [Planctomycetaceae bacterium SH412]